MVYAYIGDGKCVIDIDVDNRNYYDRATDLEIKRAVADLLSRCVFGTPSSGGMARGLGEL